MAAGLNETLLQTIREVPLLNAAQLEELTLRLAPRCVDPKALIRELLERNWLTAYQANQLLQGKGRELMLGSYLLLARIGRGGMGEVFKARHVLMGRVVALKIIRADYLPSADAVSRFQQEIKAAARMSHPNVVLAHDANHVGDTYFLVMEYVEGTDLAQLLRQRQRVPAGEACSYLCQTALGLQHIHERGLVHRDIKPSNLLLSAEGVVKVLDLGLARLRAGFDSQRMTLWLTGAGTVMGTPDYIAPEQARDSAKVDSRADLYSLGCAGYHLLAGLPPFPGGSLTEKLLRHQQDQPPSLRELCPELSAGLAAVIERLLAKRPEDRLQTAGEVAAALQAFAGPGAVPPFPAAIPVRTGTPGDTPTAPYHLEAPQAALPDGTESKQSAARPTASATVPLLPGRSRKRLILLAGAAGALAVSALVVGVVIGLRRPAANDPRKPAGTNPVVEGVRSGEEGGKLPGAASPEDGWHKEARELVENLLVDKLDSLNGLRLYTDLTLALERQQEITWFIGSQHTRRHRPTCVKVRGGKLLTEELSAEQAQKLHVKEDAMQENVPDSFRLGQQPLVVLSQPELRLKTTPDGLELVGQVHCTRQSAQPLRFPLVVLRIPLKQDNGAEKNPGSYQNCLLPLEVKETPSGPLELTMQLPPGTTLDSGARLRLEAVLSWPRPSFYQISNELTITVR